MSNKTTDVLIAGGGIAGLTAALAFADQGFGVICVEPDEDPDQSALRDRRSTAFLQPSVNFLSDIGVWSKLADRASPLGTMRIVEAGNDDQTPKIVDFCSDELGAEPFAWNLANEDLRKILLDIVRANPAIQLLNGVSVVEFITRSDTSFVTLSSGLRLRAKLVVAADGRSSRLREICEIGVKTTTYDQLALAFRLHHTQSHDDVSTEIHAQGGPFTLVPLGGTGDKNHSAVIWMDTTQNITTLQALDDASFNQQAQARSLDMMGSVALEGSRIAWPMISQMADRISAQRCVLIGEAAHVVPPIGAQGLNMSLTDIATLVALTRNAPDPGDTKIIDGYASKRQKAMRLRVAGIDALNRTSIAGSRVAKLVRRTGLDLIGNAKPVRKLLMEAGLGLRL
jgi:2-octaprenyl-6-methoxyphenol hydroxylase